jgi:hypothetical protein
MNITNGVVRHGTLIYLLPGSGHCALHHEADTPEMEQPAKSGRIGRCSVGKAECDAEFSIIVG